VGYGEEFFGRQIDFVVFTGLTRDVIEQVLRRQLARLAEVAGTRGYALAVGDEVVDHLLTGWTPRVGARFAFTILQQRVEEQLALAEIEGQLDGVRRIHLRLLPAAAEPGAASREVPGGGPTEEIGRARRRREGDTLVVFVA